MIEWRPINGFNGLYEVSTAGEVRSIVTDHSRRTCILKPHEKNGYLAITLYSKNCSKHFYIHRLVAQTFLPRVEGKNEVNHIDCNKFNNSIENLEWCNRKENLEHSYVHGLKRQGELHGCHKLTEKEVQDIRHEYVRNSKTHGIRSLAQKYKVSLSTIQTVVSGVHWKNLLQGGTKK